MWTIVHTDGGPERHQNVGGDTSGWQSVALVVPVHVKRQLGNIPVSASSGSSSKAMMSALILIPLLSVFVGRAGRLVGAA